MAKVQIQFHAAPEEAISLAVGWARDHGLTAVLEQFFPSYRAVALDHYQSLEDTGLQHVDRIALCGSRPDLAATGAYDFRRA